MTANRMLSFGWSKPKKRRWTNVKRLRFETNLSNFQVSHSKFCTSWLCDDHTRQTPRITKVFLYTDEKTYRPKLKAFGDVSICRSYLAETPVLRILQVKSRETETLPPRRYQQSARKIKKVRKQHVPNKSQATAAWISEVGRMAVVAPTGIVRQAPWL